MEITTKKEVGTNSTLQEWHDSHLNQRLFEIFENNWKLAEASLGIKRTEEDRAVIIPDAYEIVIQKFGWIKFHELLTAFKKGRIAEAEKKKDWQKMTIGDLLSWIRTYASPNRIIATQTEFKGEEAERIKRNQTLSDAEWLDENLHILWENITGAYGAMLAGKYLNGVVNEAKRRIGEQGYERAKQSARMKWKSEIQKKFTLGDKFFTGKTPSEIEKRIRMRHPTETITPIELMVKIEIIREYKKLKGNG